MESYNQNIRTNLLFHICQKEKIPLEIFQVETSLNVNDVYPSETKKLPSFSTATSVGLQKCSKSLPGTNLSPSSKSFSPSLEYLNT